MNIELRPSLIRQYLIATIVNLGSLTTGISLVWSSPMSMKLRNGTDIPLSRHVTQEEESWVISGGYLAAVGLAFFIGILIDKMGRKVCIILVSVPRIFASIWTIYVTEVWMLIFCRIVMTFTDCYIFVVIPVYISEIASKEHRGSLGTFLHILSCLGIVITYAIGPFLSYTQLNAVLAITIFLSSVPLPFLPESPVYLYSKGRIDEAVEVLNKIRDSDVIVQQELEDYQSSKLIKIDKIALMKNKVFLKSLALGILICAGSNANGFCAVAFYLQTILESTHSSLKPEFASAVIGCVQLFAAICTSFFTKMFGRRPMLIYPLLGTFIGMIGLGTFFTISSREGEVTGFLNYIPIICLVLCTYCHNVGIGCLVLVVTAELFDGPARAIGYSISFIFFLLLAFLTSKYLAGMTSALGPAMTYWFFSALCLLVCFSIILFIPETKGKTFNEIQIALNKRSNDSQVSKNHKQENNHIYDSERPN